MGVLCVNVGVLCVYIYVCVCCVHPTHLARLKIALSLSHLYKIKQLCAVIGKLEASQA